MASLSSTLSQTSPKRPTLEQMRLRNEAARRYDPPIPPLPMQGGEAQYRDPGQLGRMLLSSVTRYVARTTAHPGGTAIPVAAVRCYLGECSNLSPENFANGADPLDPTLFRAWYLGEYDAAGRLAPTSEGDMLYWLLPILSETPPADHDEEPDRPGPGPLPRTRGGKILNCLRIHAGDGNKEEMP